MSIYKSNTTKKKNKEQTDADDEQNFLEKQ